MLRKKDERSKSQKETKEMPRFTEDDLQRLLKRNKHVTIQANGCNVDPETFRPGKPSELERTAGEIPLAKTEGKEAGSGRFLVCFVSVRKRLLDPDNISEKWMLDCLRYCRAIPGDEPEKIELQTTQRKCRKSEDPHTEIEVYQLT